MGRDTEAGSRAALLLRLAAMSSREDTGRAVVDAVSEGLAPARVLVVARGSAAWSVVARSAGAEPTDGVDPTVAAAADRALLADGPVEVEGPGTVLSLAAPAPADGRVARVLVVTGTREDGLLEEDLGLVATAAATLRRLDEVAGDRVALDRSRQVVALLVERLPAIVWTTDENLVATSTAGTDTTGAKTPPAFELAGRPAVEFVQGAAGRDLAARELGRVLDGEAAEFTVEVFGRLWRTHSEPLHDEDGGVVGTRNVSFDVTRAAEQESELVAVRDRLQGLWDHASNGMLLAGDDGRYVDVNPAAIALTGRSRADLLGATPALITGASETLMARVWADFLARGSTSGVWPLDRPDGRRIVVAYDAVAHIVPGVHLCILQDTTQRSVAEEALAASEARFRAIAEQSQDAVYLLRTSPVLEVSYLNGSIEELVGFTPDQIEGDLDLFLTRLHEDDHAQFRQLLADGAGTMLVRYLHRDGSWRWLEVWAVPLLEGDATVGIQGTIRDVSARERTEAALRTALDSERRSLEELQTLHGLKSSFLRAVSHELRTPLTGIMGYSETLAEHGDRLSEDRRRGLYDRLRSNALRLERLLADVLDLERLSRGARSLDLETVDARQLVDRVLAEVDSHGREVVVEVADGDVVVDVTVFERILENLLHNAMKHTPPGTRVCIRLVADGDEVDLVVEDDGPGVPDDLLQVVFEAFRQGPSMTRAASPGTGIGLSLVRQLAATHGGWAWIDEDHRLGARFRVRLSSLADRPGRPDEDDTVDVTSHLFEGIDPS
jgi:hypothetical protein